jgi:hypothetical protein
MEKWRHLLENARSEATRGKSGGTLWKTQIGGPVGLNELPEKHAGEGELVYFTHTNKLTSQRVNFFMAHIEDRERRS